MRKGIKKLLTVALTATLGLAALAGCGTGTSSNGDGSANGGTTKELSGKIQLAGSTSMEKMCGALMEAFMEEYPNVTVTTEYTGSGAGIESVTSGAVDIGNASRALSDKEKSAGIEENIVAIDGIAMITDKNNKVTNVTKQQLTDIYTGKITNWKEVGGADEAIVLITRPESSGTRATFKKYALDGASEASNKSMETDDSGVLLQNVKTTKGAIGYVALSYLVSNPGVDTVSIDGVEPTLENTYAGKYPVWTYEHMYTKGNADEVSQKFLDYITSDEYGKKMESLGYGVSSKMTVKEH